jgi:ATP-dependent DNA ligase
MPLRLPLLMRQWRHSPSCAPSACGPIRVADIRAMLWRVRNSRGRLKNAPAAFIEPCRPTVSQRPPRGSGWAHELKHDGYL